MGHLAESGSQIIGLCLRVILRENRKKRARCDSLCDPPSPRDLNPQTHPDSPGKVSGTVRSGRGLGGQDDGPFR